jgi:hypothetical protein
VALLFFIAGLLLICFNKNDNVSPMTETAAMMTVGPAHLAKPRHLRKEAIIYVCVVWKAGEQKFFNSFLTFNDNYARKSTRFQHKH